MTKSANPKPEPDSSSEIDPEIIAKIAQLRVQMRESFGKVVMAMMALPRYRHQTLADLCPYPIIGRPVGRKVLSQMGASRGVAP